MKPHQLLTQTEIQLKLKLVLNQKIAPIIIYFSLSLCSYVTTEKKETLLVHMCIYHNVYITRHTNSS